MNIIDLIEKSENLSYAIFLTGFLIISLGSFIFPKPVSNSKIILLKKYVIYLIVLIILFIIFHFIELKIPLWIIAFIVVSLFPLILAGRDFSNRE